jgi:Tfp pilus assembly protein PilX
MNIMRQLIPARVRLALASESGFVMAIAMLSLFIMGVLAVAAVSVSISTSHSTTRDEASKSALEAAEAGLRAATYRLNMVGPGEKLCLNSSNAVEEPSGVEYCVGPEESLGNNATFKYWVTKANTGGSCAGEALSGSSQLFQRCVTAEGIINKGTNLQVTQRLQARVAALQASTNLFTVAGFVGLEELKVTGSVSVKGLSASNGKIIGEGSANFEKGYEIGPSGSFKPAAGEERTKSGVKVEGPETQVKENFVYALPTNHATAESNEDNRISEKIDESYENKAKAIEYQGTPNYTLFMTSEPKLTLGGSKYYFCNVKLEKASKLIIASGAKTEIFIDSPEDKSSKCAAGTGNFEILNNSKIENLSKKPTSLLIEMYGKGKFELANGSKLEASIFAPEGEVNINGGASFLGAVVGRKLHMENGAGILEWSTEEETLKAGNAGTPIYYRTAWTPCKPSGTNASC